VGFLEIISGFVNSNNLYTREKGYPALQSRTRICPDQVTSRELNSSYSFKTGIGESLSAFPEYQVHRQ
jgi:hypothetical protein